MKILILGGYGVFGGRLVELLKHAEDFDLVVVGRQYEKASAFCADIEGRCESHGMASLTPLAGSRDDVARLLHQHRPQVLVDASGPFQEYGATPYSVVEACIDHGVHYLDFADGAEFVGGVAHFDGAARAAGVAVLSGVSSFPVLTAAVVAHAQTQFQVKSVEGGIAPSPYAGVGLNVMRAVLGYAGARVRRTRRGKPALAPGLVESRRYTIAPPGRLPLRNLRFSLVEVPDLQVIPTLYPDIEDIWIGAGPVPAFLHRLLSLLAAARYWLRLPSPAPLARLCHWVINQVRYGEHRGGMYLRLCGGDGVGERCMTWHLLAEGDDGPFIPSMAIEVLLRKMRDGRSPRPGARAAAGELSLDDYAQAFAGRRIHTGIRLQERQDELGSEPSGLFQSVLGASFTALPLRLQQLHAGDQTRCWSGNARVLGATTPLGWIAAKCFGFPARNGEVPVTVETRVHPREGVRRESWVRQFGSRRFMSVLSEGRGRERYLVLERFGPVTVALALVWDGEKLWFVPRAWRLGWLALPRALLPRGESFETQRDGQFAFDVTIELPLIGRVVRYAGQLESDPGGETLA